METPAGTGRSLAIGIRGPSVTRYDQRGIPAVVVAGRRRYRLLSYSRVCDMRGMVEAGEDNGRIEADAVFFSTFRSSKIFPRWQRTGQRAVIRILLISILE